jgi:formamidopyrimidine-DNA glycosylase
VPELIEVEAYRVAAEAVVGRTIEAAEHPDPWVLRGGPDPAGLAVDLQGAVVEGLGRRGKLLVVETDAATIGLRFGMTGRLVVDGRAPIEQLLYGPPGAPERWLRLRWTFVGGGSLDLVDPRRLGRIEVDPDLDRLGPDAASLTLSQLRDALGGSVAPLKARLLDQSRVAGIGNLIVDETLWRAGISPVRPAGDLDDGEVRVLHRRLRSTISMLTARGGSHTGDLQPARIRGAACPRCGAPLRRDEVGGRTTFWCPAHQR